MCINEKYHYIRMTRTRIVDCGDWAMLTRIDSSLTIFEPKGLTWSEIEISTPYLYPGWTVQKVSVDNPSWSV
jgi:hypothetical protein